MIVSIHQPNYMPWLGYFDKILKSDIFVVFDDVQFPRGKFENFGNRNQIKFDKGKKWITVPLIGKSELKTFNTIEINYNDWNIDHLNRINSFYRKSPYLNNYYTDIESILMSKYKCLSNLNVALLQYLLKCLEINTKIVISSEVSTENFHGQDKIMDLLKKLGATKYISGAGAGSIRYIREQDFVDNNIELIWQKYIHPTYNQLHGEFIPYLSIIDLLFNEGEKSKEIIRI